jgi:group I intron endonuclease
MSIVSGIYAITNLVNNKVYVGSAISLSNRKATHFYKLRNNAHGNPHLQNAFNKYKEENFVFEVLEIVDNCSILINIEQKYIDEYKNKNIKLYNICIVAGSTFGKQHTSETKRKMSINRVGIKNPFFGKTHTDEIKKRLSIINKTNNPFQGKKHTSQSKQKMKLSIPKGETHHNSKLNKQSVDKIRQTYLNEKVSYAKIAKQFNVSSTLVCKIINNKLWFDEEYNKLIQGKKL